MEKRKGDTGDEGRHRNPYRGSRLMQGLIEPQGSGNAEQTVQEIEPVTSHKVSRTKEDARHNAAYYCQDRTYTADSHEAYVSHGCYPPCCREFVVVVRHSNVVEPGEPIQGRFHRRVEDFLARHLGGRSSGLDRVEVAARIF